MDILMEMDIILPITCQLDNIEFSTSTKPSKRA